MSDLPQEWFPHHIEGVITPVAQAKLYPYPAPATDYWMKDGIPFLRPEGISGDELAGRTAVLSVGSNRAPLQLRRKFGNTATLPVTTCKLHDADIVYASTLSFYCASPATACPCPGTVVDLNIAWLDEEQLLIMHETEALGVAYDFIQFNDGVVDHGRVQDHPIFSTPVFGYQSRSPLLNLGGGPVAHEKIPASRRPFMAMSQEDVLSTLKDHVSAQEQLDQWILKMREDRSYRLEVMAQMTGLAMPCPQGPWRVLDVKAQRPDDFL